MVREDAFCEYSLFFTIIIGAIIGTKSFIIHEENSKEINITLAFTKSEEDYRQILLTLFSILSQNTDEFQKQVQTLESFHPLISRYRQELQPACLYLEFRG